MIMGKWWYTKQHNIPQHKNGMRHEVQLEFFKKVVASTLALFLHIVVIRIPLLTYQIWYRQAIYFDLKVVLQSPNATPNQADPSSSVLEW